MVNSFDISLKVLKTDYRDYHLNGISSYRIPGRGWISNEAPTETEFHVKHRISRLLTEGADMVCFALRHKKETHLVVYPQVSVSELGIVERRLSAA